MYLYIKALRVWAVRILICSCGDQVLAVDYRWLAGFWISFLWYPLNAFTPFEVMSVLKYLSPFMFSHECLRSRISFLFFPFSFFLFLKRVEMKASATVSIHQKSGEKSGKSPAHNEAWLARTQREATVVSASGLKSWLTGGSLTELHHCSVTGFDRLIWCFAAVMSFTVSV